MISTTSQVIKHTFAALTAAALFTACSDRTPAGLQARPGDPARELTASTEAQAASYSRPADITSCPEIAVPAGSKQTFHVFGKGVQIYRWNGVKWDFVSPDAKLYADAAGNGLVGTHFGGPTWKTLSGSQVVGTVSKRCTPDANSIQWLLLDAKAGGAGVFENTTLIQRTNTVGGNPPNRTGAANEEVSVPYTADYFFYRAPTL